MIDRYKVQQHTRDRRANAQPGSVVWLLGTLAEGRYTSLGSYPKYWLTKDGGTLSYAAVRAELRQIMRAMRDAAHYRWTDEQWCVVACDVNWEDADLHCDHTGERIESAYAEPES